mmetsp:Transcript_47739/g.144347  ORF Transcript_47739/g.144347 Transcript_47739/m.144347 type:complete len:164 (-) Transcript_47739:228-719(-)
MVLTKLAETMGLLDFLAPKQKASAKRRKDDEMKRGESSTREAGGDRGGAPGERNERRAGATENVNRSDEDHRRRRLRVQLEAERAAERHGKLAKKQRVSYHHKASDRRYEAVVVGVHYDDGPDHPYYTIKYSKENDEEMEKQTTPDRLERLPWNEDASWEIMK